MDWVTTSTILDGLREPTNQTAWDRLAARFRAPIVQFARRRGLPVADAEDVAQETLSALVDACRNGRFDPKKGRLSKFLFGIAYRQTQNAFRKKAHAEIQIARTANTSTTFWSNLPDERSAEESWDGTWERTVMTQCLAQIRLEVQPQTYRAFELTALAGLAPGVVAEQLDMSKNAVVLAKHRIVKRLRELRLEYEETV